MTRQAVKAYRFLQTDGVKVQGERTSISILNLTVRNTGQALDLWTSDSFVDGVTAIDIGLSPIKLIYGASGNQLRRIRCKGTGLAALVVDSKARTPAGTTAKNNRIEIQATDVGRLWQREGKTTGVSQQAAFLVNGEHEPLAERKSSGNTVVGWAEGFIEEGRSMMPYVGLNQDAGINRFLIGGTGFSEHLFRSTGAARPDFLHVLRKPGDDRL